MKEKTDTQTQDRPPDVKDNQCPECDGTIIKDGVSRVCNNCGLVVDEQTIDHGPDWRGDDVLGRAGRPVDRTRSDNGFDTKIGSKNADISERQHRLLRATRFSTFSESKKEQIQANAIADIKRAADILNTTAGVGDMACVLFKQMHNSEDHTGKNIDTMCAASLYAAARCKEGYIKSEDVCVAFDIDSESDLFSEVNRLKQTIDLPIPLRRPRHHIAKFVNEMDGDERVQTYAHRMALAIEEEGVFNGSAPAPSGVAAGIVYIAFKQATWCESRTQNEISSIAEVSRDVVVRHKDTIKNTDVDVKTSDLPTIND